MASAKRLIDANKLEKLIHNHLTMHLFKEDILAAIAKQPTVDAVEVVRCKECGKWDKATGCCSEFTSTRLPTGGRIAFVTGEDDFCSYGERKSR